ncbi:hypothetical protein TPHA_0E03180 [Tetrapisispora phaffii CBS 4417]|uniref:LsmAD domain-containing protein n=1 Tax=Tetrapisispora phaffii (strain ATCC 24235 / CBS 4417 / NBRC 1672 / NRRL Y-8282 / UCD 70-5) TaxID=1071381 RepID=G8BU30_TETPH|nr:hypothetical protein TPHA_0E03180 [Tetrapisispora phaffii CBS 4417]CCE63408.1 hypothetical protein TPHA_0E03180 [Tetrapisispora phaffii CBS 4417]
MKGGNFSNKKQSGGSSYHNSNRSHATSQAMFAESPETLASFTDRQDYLFVNSIGSEVTATLFSGTKFSGILSAYNPESKEGIEIVLKFPKLVDVGFSDIDTKDSETKLGETLLFHGKDVAELELNNISFSLDEKYEQANKKREIISQQPIKQQNTTSHTEQSSKFKTDVDISKSAPKIKERELQKWAPEADDSSALNQGLDDGSSNWDQFAVNEKKFGVTSSYDEHFYTTKIDKSHPEYRKRLQEAEKLAKEIESQGSSNIHVAEDRGLIIDDSGMDEEDKYSGVDRRGDELLAALKSNTKPIENKPSKYVPPTLRHQPHHIDPAIISSVTEQSTVGAPASTMKAGPTLNTKNIEGKSDSTKISYSNVVKNGIQKTIYSVGTSTKENFNSKETQIEDLKKFSQKFKVPFKVPEDMKEVVKKSEEPKDSNSTKGSSKASSSGKGTDGKRPSISSRRRHATIFFGSQGLPHSNNRKKEIFNNNFNMFESAKASYDKNIEKAESEMGKEEKIMQPFIIEKPYFTAPTWESTIEKSHKALFPDERVLVQKAQMRLQQRQMRSYDPNMGNHQMQMAMGGMIGYPMSTAGINPLMNGGMSMYVPMQQPMMYPGMVPQMVGVMGSSGKEGAKGMSPQQQYQSLGYGGPAPVHLGNPYMYQGGMTFNQGMAGHSQPQNSHYKPNSHHNSNFNRHNNNNNIYYYNNNNYKNNNNSHYNNHYRNNNANGHPTKNQGNGSESNKNSNTQEPTSKNVNE